MAKKKKVRQLEFDYGELDCGSPAGPMQLSLIFEPSEPAAQGSLLPPPGRPPAPQPPAQTSSGPSPSGMEPAVPQRLSDEGGAHSSPSPGKAAPPASLSHEAYAVEPPSLPPNTRWRVISVDDTRIGFLLRRSRRKSIGLAIGEDGLTVTSPHWVTLSQVDEAVIAKSAWILRKLAERQERKEQLATAETAWQHGGTIPYFGVRIRLVLGEQPERAAFSGEPFMPRDGDCLRLALPQQADHTRVRDAVQAWLQQQAQAWFGQRLEHFLQKGQLRINRWRLSSAATRWGSCNSDGNIMLNWRLIHFPHDAIDYVIAHEVAHLRELNHSPRFWQEVGRLMPGFETARNVLKTHTPDTLPLL